MEKTLQFPQAERFQSGCCLTTPHLPETKENIVAIERFLNEHKEILTSLRESRKDSKQITATFIAHLLNSYFISTSLM